MEFWDVGCSWRGYTSGPGILKQDITNNWMEVYFSFFGLALKMCLGVANNQLRKDMFG